MGNPKIEVTRSREDKILDIVGFLMLAGMLVYAMVNYGNLPDEIPTHFGFNGKPDNFSPKFNVFVVPIIGLLLYTVMYLLNHVPHLFNYPTDITIENAPQQYRAATKAIRILNVFLAAIFFYLTFAIIRTAKGLQEGLGSTFGVILIVGLIGMLVYTSYMSLKKKQ